RVAPGNVRAIGHREIRFVIAGKRLLAAEDEARLRRFLGKASGKHLVHTDAALEHGALLQGSPREDVPRLAGMNADTGGVLVEQAGDEVEPAPERCQGLETLAQVHGRAGVFDALVLWIDSIAHEK